MGTGAVEVVSAEAIRGGEENRRIGGRVAGVAAPYIHPPHRSHVLSLRCHLRHSLEGEV
jgi:hypothetical protein